jgi:hypothetical protein
MDVVYDTAYAGALQQFETKQLPNAIQLADQVATSFAGYSFNTRQVMYLRAVAAVAAINVLAIMVGGQQETTSPPKDPINEAVDRALAQNRIVPIGARIAVQRSAR